VFVEHVQLRFESLKYLTGRNKNKFVKMVHPNLFTALVYGPQGPMEDRIGDDNWGKSLDDAFEGKDNENFLEKTAIISKHSAVFATMITIIDVNMFNTKGGIPNVLKRIKYHFVPWIGCSVAYTATASIACSLRGGKTDTTNHVIAGFAAGTAFGKYTRSFITGMTSGCLFAFLGWLYKDSRIEGYEVVPAIWKKHPRHGMPFTHKNDYTSPIFRDRPGYWARSEAEVEEVFKRGQLSNGDSTRRLW